MNDKTLTNSDLMFYRWLQANPKYHCNSLGFLREIWMGGWAAYMEGAETGDE